MRLLLLVQRGLQWYTKKLQTHPYSTNASAAVVLMTVGDVTAQTIEQQQEQTTTTRERKSATKESNSSGCSSPMLSETKKNDTSTTTRPRTTSTTTIDWVRTGTMVVWAGAFYAPFFVFLYRRIFDRYLPIGGLVGIGGRVLLSLVVSVPVNATFYVYGSLAHYGLSYLAADQHHHLGHNNNFGGGGGDSMSRRNGDVPYHDSPQQQQDDSSNTHQQRLLPRSLSLSSSWLEPAMMMAHRKIRAELSDTVKTSACVWVPLNGVNFSIVPPVYRPLVVMAGSAGWNAYLSLAQYRVVP
jgi:Mpv17 / PMP22 family